MPLMTPSEALVETLRAEGVSEVTGVVGSAFQDALDLFPAAGIRFIPVRHEQAAAHMADAYARASGKVGVCIGQNGPGCTNMVTAVACADYAHSPIVVITPSSLSTGVGTGGFQEADQMAIFRSITRHQAQVAAPSRMAETLRTAFREATCRQGPVQIDIPRDYFYGDTQQDILKPSQYRAPIRCAGDRTAIANAVELLSTAKRPVIVAGYGVVLADGHEATARLAEQLTAPVCNGFWHNDSFPHNHALAMGPLGFGGSRAAMETIREADVVLMLGSRINVFGYPPQHGMEYYPAQAKIIQVDRNGSELGRNKPIDVGIAGDARLVAESILSGLQEIQGVRSPEAKCLTPLLARRKAWFSDLQAMCSSTSTPIHPFRALNELTDQLTAETIVTTDVGFVSGAALGFIRPTRPRKFIPPTNFANCGFGLPAALGAKLACPDDPVVLIAGDGGWAMSMAEVMTSIEEDLPVCCVVLNNGQLGAEKANQAAVFDQRYLGVDVGRQFNYADIATAMGADAVRVTEPDQLQSAYRNALASDRTSVVEVMVDPAVMNKPFRGEALLQPVRHLARYQPAAQNTEEEMS